MLTGSSMHNQRIEHLWNDMHRCATVLYYKLFYYMEHHGLLNSLNEYHLWALHYIYLPRISRSLNEFTNSWNNYAMRTANHKSPLQLFTAGLLLQNSQISALDLFDDVDDSYGIDPEGSVSVASDNSGIEIPENTLRFSERDIHVLKQTIDPCAPSDNYGIHLYEQTLQCISNLNTI